MSFRSVSSAHGCRNIVVDGTDINLTRTFPAATPDRPKQSEAGKKGGRCHTSEPCG
jgi:hypothetical protein